LLYAHAAKGLVLLRPLADFYSATDTPQYCKGLFTILSHSHIRCELAREIENDFLSDP
jgi:hypothetical protein